MTRLRATTAPLFLAALLAACGSPPYLPGRTTAPAAPTAGVTHHDGFFAGAGGLELYEQSWQASAPRAVLVIVHGLKDHSDRYAAFATGLASSGVSVYAADLRGHGHSEGERVYVDSFEQYLGDLDVLLRFVRAREPGVPLFLFGHSMGGAIATLYTIERQPRLAGLVLSGAALRADVSGFKIFGTKLVAGLSPHAGVFQLDPHEFSRDPAVVDSGMHDPLVYQGPAPARTAKELLGAIDAIDDHMEDVGVPLLVLHGSADKVTPPEGSQELYRRARSVDKTLTLYDGLVHDLLHEPEKDRVAGDIAAWIAKRAPPVRAAESP